MDINTKINWLEEQLFYLSMKDRWNSEDYDLNYKWHTELVNLKKQRDSAIA